MLNTKSVLVGAFLCILTLLPSTGIAEDRISEQMGFPIITNEGLIKYYATKYNTSSTTLMRVMNCESGGNQLAIGDNGEAVGLFQFHKALWKEISQELNIDLDRYSAHDQIKAAAYAFSTGRAGRWTCK